MKILYNIAMLGYNAVMHLAVPFHKKAKQKVSGLQRYWSSLESAIPPTADVVWVHAASLGELEQGWPIIKKIRSGYPSHLILLTFSSPSGLEHFENDGTVDVVRYLPVDTAHNAELFVSTTAPDLAFFIKYEIWLNYLKNLQKAKVPTILAPAVFRENQIYFKGYAKNTFLPVLKNIDRILVQDQKSKDLLEEHDFQNVEVAGDSRYDRALEISNQPFEDSVLNDFSSEKFTLIGGSTWQEDEEILLECLKENRDIRLILAPHKVNDENIDRIRKLFGKSNCALYSVPPINFRKTRVLIIDKIGILSKAYRYGSAAFIGGGFQHGLHNTIEAVVYGIPLFFGPKHQNFVEPQEMLDAGFAFEINKKDGVTALLKKMQANPHYYQQLCEKAANFPKGKTGGTAKIMHHIERLVYKLPENYEFA